MLSSTRIPVLNEETEHDIGHIVIINMLMKLVTSAQNMHNLIIVTFLYAAETKCYHDDWLKFRYITFVS
jgi:hypothetical protein